MLKNGNLQRHITACKICNHERKEKIEEDYLSFRSVREMEEEYGLSDTGIWRHAKALGLDKLRLDDMTKYWATVVVKARGTPKSVDALRASENIAKVRGTLVEKHEHTITFSEAVKLVHEQAAVPKPPESNP